MHLVHETHRGSDIFWRLFLRRPISEVSFSQQSLIWPSLITLLIEGRGQLFAAVDQRVDSADPRERHIQNSGTARTAKLSRFAQVGSRIHERLGRLLWQILFLSVFETTR